MEKIFVVIGAIVGIISAMTGVGLLLAFPVKWTWNATIPYLFGLPTITWGKAWCIHFLCGCLVKSNNINTK